MPVADQSNSTTRRHGVPERRNQWLLILGIVVALLVAAVALSTLRRDGSTDLLRADPGALDFGVVWSDESFSWTVPLQNESGRELTIRDVNSSCGCGTVKTEPPLPCTVASGASAQLKLLLDLSPSRSSPPTREPREIEATFRLGVENSLPVAFTLRGRVRDAIAPETQAVHFGETLSRGVPFASRHVVVRELAPLSQLTAECDPALGSVRVSSLAEDHGRHKVVFLPNPQLPEGSFAAAIKLTCTTVDGEVLPPVSIPVAGNVLPEIRCIPPGLDVGVHAIGDTVDESVVLHSSGGRPFEILDTTTAFEDNTCDLRVVESGDGAATSRRTFVVSVGLQKTEHNSAKIEFAIRDPDGQTKTIVLPVKGYGVQDPAAGKQASAHPTLKL